MAEAIAATPALKPSMLSSILNEFTSATIHSTLTIDVSQGTLTNIVIFQPRATTRMATPNCTASRGRQESPQRSSARPNSISTVPAASRNHRLGACSARPDRCGRTNAGIGIRLTHSHPSAPRERVSSHNTICPAAIGTTTPSQIAMPPPKGVVRAWTLRWPGSSTSPHRGARGGPRQPRSPRPRPTE